MGLDCDVTTSLMRGLFYRVKCIDKVHGRRRIVSQVKRQAGIRFTILHVSFSMSAPEASRASCCTSMIVSWYDVARARCQQAKPPSRAGRSDLPVDCGEPV